MGMLIRSCHFASYLRLVFSMFLGELCAKALASEKKIRENTSSLPPEKGVPVYPDQPCVSSQDLEAMKELAATMGKNSCRFLW